MLRVSPQSVRLERPIIGDPGFDLSFEHAAPGMRGRLMITLQTPGQVILKLNYTGLVTRTDAYNDVGSVYVNGVFRSDFVCPTPHVSGTAHPVAPVEVPVLLEAGSSLVEWLHPYCAGLETTGLQVPAAASIAAPQPRPTTRYVVFGDSRVHGFNASSQRESWTHKLGEANNAEVLNIGYGGRRIFASDGTVAGGYGAAGAIYLSGFNDFYPGNASLSAIQEKYQNVITNYRAAATSAAAPTSRLILLSDLDAPAAYDGGTYAANSPALQGFRDAMAAAVMAVADPYCIFLSGNSEGMPAGSGSFPDGIHPNDAAATLIAQRVAAVMPL